MKRDCPTIQELLAFDAVARYESVTLAAGALCLTVSAVSKQVAGLERFLGHALLRKNGRSVQLTHEGRLYWQKVSGALRTIETASFDLRAGQSGSGLLTLASVPTFLTAWLIPRLGQFRALHPGITLSFGQHLGPFDSIPPGVDAAIRYGKGDWPGQVSDYLIGREFVAIGAPSLLPQGPLSPRQVAELPLLHHEEGQAAWRQWAAHHGVSEMSMLPGPRFAQYTALIQAAANGLGVGLAPRVLVQDALNAGSLRLACEDAMTFDQGHYLCYRVDRQDFPVFNAFRDWVMAQVGAEGGTLPA